MLNKGAALTAILNLIRYKIMTSSFRIVQEYKMYMICAVKSDRSKKDFTPTFWSHDINKVYRVVLENWRTEMQVFKIEENVFHEICSDEAEFTNKGHVTDELIEKATELQFDDLTAELKCQKASRDKECANVCERLERFMQFFDALHPPACQCYECYLQKVDLMKWLNGGGFLNLCE